MKIALTGATGFLGKHLLAVMAGQGDQINALVRTPNLDLPEEVTPVLGDILDEKIWDPLLRECSTLIHLVYSEEVVLSDYLVSMERMVESCIKNQVKHLVYCSTAVVVGAARETVLDEKTSCAPKSEYEIRKWKIEEHLKKLCDEQLDLTILRPTAIFGPGGKNLFKLATEVTGEASMGKRLLKLFVFGQRRMHLVSVDTVVDAVLFLIRREKKEPGIYIVSEDDVIQNNYRDVERIVSLKLKSESLPRVQILVPDYFLSFLLRWKGLSNIDPRRTYSSQKLKSLGFRKSKNFEESLDRFASWFRENKRKL